MSRKISFGLSVKEINIAIQEIRQYKADLNNKCEEFCRRLCEVGAEKAKGKVSESPLGKTITVSTDIDPKKTGCKAILYMSGKTYQSEGYEPVNTALLIEFGAGIHYNPEDNPKAAELGYGIGTFPGQMHAFEDGWYFKNDNDEWVYTHGTKATMPMYEASVEMRDKIMEIAKEVFDGC
jgi:hypothetical protein